MKLVKCKFLIDGTGAAAEADVGMLVDGERILEVKPLAACKDLPADIEIIDLSNSWVMPGIINAHTHLSLVPGKGNQPAQKRLPPGINVLRSLPNLLKDVRSGVTTTRIMGEENYIDIDFKKVVNEAAAAADALVERGPKPS